VLLSQNVVDLKPGGTDDLLDKLDIESLGEEDLEKGV
jgi:hypothetical protein